MMVQIFFAADDFGLTEGVTRGIVEAIRRGVVATTGAMVCVPHATAHLAQWAPAVTGRVGAHLQLTGGRPVLAPARVPTLVDGDGAFRPSRAAVAAAALHRDEIYAEWNAQIECLEAWGISVAHLDSHHHVHRLPQVFDVYCTIAQERNLPVRTDDLRMTQLLRDRGIRCGDLCLTGFYGKKATEHDLYLALRGAAMHAGPQALLEVMCHPGFLDDTLPALSKYAQGRLQELELLCDPDFPTRMRAQGIEVVDRPWG